MAWTLAEFSKIETDTLRKSVLDILLMESNLLELVPWETINQLSTTIVRVQTLPNVGYRKVNAGFSESTGKFEQKVETIALGGLDIDTDMAIARAKNTIADARASQQVMSLKAMAYDFNDKFITGDVTADPDVFKGIRLRIDDVYAEGFTDQKFAANDVDTGILNSQTTRFNFLQDFDKLIYAIKGHSPDYAIMNKKMLLALRSMLIRERLLTYNQDMFGRQIDMFGNTRLIDIGVKSDQVTEIILNTEDTAGAPSGGTENTSIYVCKFGIDEWLWGIEEYPLEVRDLGELQTAPKYRTRVDWPHGLADADQRAMARMYGIVPDASA